jgi:6,7-dimethyl-8-ribityllumazine synthase
MHNVVEGNLKGDGKKVAIIASRFNSFIVDRLIEGANDALLRHGVKEGDITLYKVPGAFEFAGFLSKFLSVKQKEFDGAICLGAVIRGETPHFDYVASESSKAIAHLSMNHSLPIGFGILTVDTLEQAINRAGAKSGNKGYECAMSILEMMDLYSKI